MKVYVDGEKFELEGNAAELVIKLRNQRDAARRERERFRERLGKKLAYRASPPRGEV